MFTYHDIKKSLYYAITIIGILLVFAAYHLINTAGTEANGLSQVITAVILVVVGGGCIFFGFETFLLRDDPDIWL